MTHGCCKRKNNNTETTLEQKTLNKILTTAKWCTLQGFYLQFLIPVVLASLNTSGLVIGLAVSVQTFGLAISGPIVGKIINRRSNLALVLSLGCVFKSFSTGVIFLGFSYESVPIIITGVFCKGISQTLVRDSFRLLIADHTPFHNRSQYLGKLRANMGIGISIGCFVGFGWLSPASNHDIPWENPNWPNEWWFKTIVAMIFFMLGNLYPAVVLPKYIKIVQSCEKQEQEHQTTSKSADQTENLEEKIHILSDEQLKHGFIGLLFLMGIEQLVGSLIRPFIIVFLREKLTNNTEQDLTIAYAPGGILSIIIAPFIGMLLDKKIKILPRYTLCIASFIGSGVTIGFIYATKLIEVIFIIMFDFTVLTVAGLSLEKMVSSISKSHRGKLFGAVTFVEQICTMLGPIFGGLLWDYVSHTTPFWASVIVETSIGIVYLVFFYIYPLDKIKSDQK